MEPTNQLRKLIPPALCSEEQEHQHLVEEVSSVVERQLQQVNLVVGCLEALLHQSQLLVLQSNQVCSEDQVHNQVLLQALVCLAQEALRSLNLQPPAYLEDSQLLHRLNLQQGTCSEALNQHLLNLKVSLEELQLLKDLEWWEELQLKGLVYSEEARLEREHQQFSKAKDSLEVQVAQLREQVCSVHLQDSSLKTSRLARVSSSSLRTSPSLLRQGITT